MDLEKFLLYEQAVNEGWERLTWVQTEHNSQGDMITKVAESFQQEAINEWCETRCKGPWVAMWGTVLIKNPKDAMLFKLAFYNQDSR